MWEHVVCLSVVDPCNRQEPLLRSSFLQQSLINQQLVLRSPRIPPATLLLIRKKVIHLEMIIDLICKYSRKQFPKQRQTCNWSVIGNCLTFRRIFLNQHGSSLHHPSRHSTSIHTFLQRIPQCRVQRWESFEPESSDAIWARGFPIRHPPYPFTHILDPNHHLLLCLNIRKLRPYVLHPASIPIMFRLHGPNTLPKFHRLCCIRSLVGSAIGVSSKFLVQLALVVLEKIILPPCHPLLNIPANLRATCMDLVLQE